MSSEYADLYQAYLRPSRGPRASRRVEVSTALAAIPNNARVHTGSGCGAPMQLLEAMAAERNRWDALTLSFVILFAPIAPMQYAGKPFRFAALQPTAVARAAAEAGYLETIPARFSDIAWLFTPEGTFPADAVLVHVSPPGPEGRFSLGTSVGGVIDTLRTAPLVIAQVNQEMPYTYGAGELRRDEIDLLVEMDGPLVELQRAPPNPTARRIAEEVAGLIPDGATVQIGIGAVTEALCPLLQERRDLGYHSGMVADGVIDLMECGALTNARKSIDRDLVIAAEVVGTRRLFDWVHRNPRVRLVPPSYTHGVSVLARIERFVANNSAVQVSLDGTVNAESLGGRQLSGPGGQPDFAEGAMRAPKGMSIIALPATAAKGKISRIVPQIPAGETVSVPRYLADRVVTEFGVAELRGRTLSQRAEALRAIAAPAFRADLA